MSSKSRKHPYMSGNFAPIRKTIGAEPCAFEGFIPDEFLGGQYVRNGSNPLYDNTNCKIHWFDGDGMLTGVYFKRTFNKTRVQPMFTNQYVRTDVYRATSKIHWLYPILPSVTTLVDPAVSRLRILLELLRSMIIIFASIYGFIARSIQRVSPANTSIIHHDGRVMATSEIGPPMRVFLPSLRTVGWFTGTQAEGELPGEQRPWPYFGGPGIEGFYKEMTTAHPRVDPHTGELLLFHSTFLPPFVQYSIIPAGLQSNSKARSQLNQPVPGLSSGRMMHDFGVSRHHTVIIACPLSLDPFKLVHNKPTIEYDPNGHTQIGVFPRHSPKNVVWYETNASIVMHTVNTWDTSTPEGSHVHCLLCRMNSIAPLYHMGNIEAPKPSNPRDPECRLYYYQFSASERSQPIKQQWALSVIPFEFPHVPRHLEMTRTRFVYGCSMRSGNFATTSITSSKIDCLVKLDVHSLIAKGLEESVPQVDGVVDKRTIQEILSSQDANDPIKVFTFPNGWYAQECSFIRRNAGKDEDDGWLVTYAFDESQLDEKGDAPTNSRSELWIIDARTMSEVVATIALPQRVPYGMHGNWFSEQMIQLQRGVMQFRDE